MGIVADRAWGIVKESCRSRTRLAGAQYKGLCKELSFWHGIAKNLAGFLERILKERGRARACVCVCVPHLMPLGGDPPGIF